MRSSTGSGRGFALWAAALAVAAIVVVNAQGWWALSRTSRAFEDELGARLVAIGNTLSAALAGRWDAPESETLLRDVQARTGLFNLFIVDENLSYLVNLADMDLAGTQDAALAPDLAGLVTALSGIPAQSPVYRSGKLYLKTAYCPLEDSSGATAAVLGVEADARFFSVLEEFRRGLLFINLLSLGAIVAVVLVAVSLVRYALSVERAAARANALALAGQMSAAVAHEIRNPLAIIRSTAQRLKKQYGAQSDDPKFGYIEDEVDRLSQVISNHLSFSRVQSGERELLDAAALVAEVADEVAPQARRSGVEVIGERTGMNRQERQEDGAGEGPGIGDEWRVFVRGGRNELKQVLLNLILNAVQAQPAGGRVALSVRRERDEVRITVKDDGPGVDRKTARMMFEPFFTTREKGSGLGLFVVRRIVEELGGRVELANPGSRGAEMVVSLPAAGEDERTERGGDGGRQIADRGFQNEEEAT